MRYLNWILFPNYSWEEDLNSKLKNKTDDKRAGMNTRCIISGLLTSSQKAVVIEGNAEGAIHNTAGVYAEK